MSPSKLPRMALSHHSQTTPDNYTIPTKVSDIQSIGRDAAIALYETGWWNTKTHRDIAGFCFSVCELCCPFDVLHEAFEKSIGRPIFTHELGLNLQGILNEFHGIEEAPSFKEIVELIPEEKRVAIYPNKP